MFQLHAESQGNDIYFSIKNNNTNQTNNIYFFDYSHFIKNTHISPNLEYTSVLKILYHFIFNKSKKH